MLHRRWMQAALVLMAGGLATPAVAQDARLRAPVTGKERTILAERIRPQLVDVQRFNPPPRNIVIPGHGPEDGVGWWAARGRVITASALVQDWPRSDGDVVRVRRPGGEWRPATVGLIDIRLGIAVLDVEPDPGDPPPPPVESPEKGSLYGGRMVYSVMPAPVAAGAQIAKRVDAGLVNVRVAGPAGGVWAYYWLIAGPVALGTPLFDARGRLVTLVGLRLATGETLAVPTRAIEALYERRFDWVP